jgi:hypothetical protein
MSFDALKDTELKAIYLNDDNTRICFETEQGCIIYNAIGDCCSESWFNHISNVQGMPLKVVKVKEHEEKEGDADGNHQKFDKIYGFTLINYSRSIDIEMRNSSNGYYGGSLDLDKFTTSVPKGFRKIEKDI